jgi:hypothetical protein
MSHIKTYTSASATTDMQDTNFNLQSVKIYSSQKSILVFSTNIAADFYLTNLNFTKRCRILGFLSESSTVKRAL